MTNDIKITKENMEILLGGGTITKNGQNFSLDNDARYLIDHLSTEMIDDNGSTKKFVTNFVDNGSTVTMTIGGVTFTVTKA